MNLLFIIDPPDSLKAYKDTTVSMMRAAEARGHAVYVCEQPSLAWHAGSVGAEALRIHLTDNDEDWYRRDGHAQRPLAWFDAVLMRKDPPFDLEYVTSTWLLSAAVREGARVFNAPDAIRDHNEKLAIAEFPALVAPTLVAREPQRLHAFIDEQGDVVLKRLDVMGGENIFRVRRDDPNRNVIVELMAQGGARSVMAQRYIPEIRDGDKRILLIDGKAVPYSLARIPKAGESRGNLAAGGTGVAQPLSARDLAIAQALGARLAGRGLLLVGLDVIGDWLTEVNVTSPTCFREIQDQTGFDVAGMFIEALAAKAGVVIGVLVISHGAIGETLLASAEAILGARQAQVATLGVSRGDDPDKLLVHARGLAAGLDSGAGVLVLTDMFGATPCNVAARLLADGRVEGVSGVSLPMLVRVLSGRNESLPAAVQRALSGGAEGVVHMNRDSCGG